jgi:hypothetical protein
MTRPAESLQDALDKTFAKDTDGKPLVRESMCECGRRFRQRLLSERFLTIVEKAKAMALFQKHVPGFWVPVHCPPCESKELGRMSRMAEYHEPRPNFGERDAA